MDKIIVRLYDMHLLATLCLAAMGSFLIQDPDPAPVDINFTPRQDQTTAYALRMRVTVGKSSVLTTATLSETINNIEKNGNYGVSAKLTQIVKETTVEKGKPTRSTEPDRTVRTVLLSRLGVHLGHQVPKIDAADYALQRYFYVTSPGSPIFEGVGWRTDWQSAQYPKVPKVSVDYELTGFTETNGVRCGVVKVTTSEQNGSVTVEGSGKCLVEVGTGAVHLYMITLNNVVIPGSQSRGTLTYYKELIR
ncbi:MAG: hypothetical protein KF784_02080 [Fimbriimonadaceae bacterium]|nr:hypothetical protein [Fimbriimonadaceae bacterium]